MREILDRPVILVGTLNEDKENTNVGTGGLQMIGQVIPNSTLILDRLSTTYPGHTRTYDSGVFARASKVLMITLSNPTTITSHTLNDSLILNDNLLMLAVHIIPPTRVEIRILTGRFGHFWVRPYRHRRWIKVLIVLFVATFYIFRYLIIPQRTIDGDKVGGIGTNRRVNRGCRS